MTKTKDVNISSNLEYWWSYIIRSDNSAYSLEYSLFLHYQESIYSHLEYWFLYYQSLISPLTKGIGYSNNNSGESIL